MKAPPPKSSRSPRQRPNPTDRPILGFDLGGSRLKAGVVVGGGVIRMEVRDLPRIGRSPEVTLDFLVTGLKDLLAREGIREGDLLGLGGGMAGAIRFPGGVVVQSPHHPEWRGFPLQRTLRSRLGIRRVVIDNDANVVALGEARHGAAMGVPDFLCLTLGSGIGGAVMLGGEIWRGIRGMAGEFGHMPARPGGRRCACGGRGCLEQYASAESLRRFAREHRLVPRGVIPAGPDAPRALVEAARSGHPEALQAFDEMGRWLAVGIATLVQALDVPLVVIAGGLAAAFPLFEERLRRDVGTHGLSPLLQGVRIRPGTLGDAAGVLGAASLLSPRPRNRHRHVADLPLPFDDR